jgi:hypothetical protein
MAPLDPRLPVADAYYFIAHEYMVGKRRQNPHVLGIGLGAALLGELVLARNLDVDGGNVYVIPSVSRSSEARSRLEMLILEGELGVTRK